MECGGLPPLVALLSAVTPAIQESAAVTIMTLALDSGTIARRARCLAQCHTRIALPNGA